LTILATVIVFSLPYLISCEKPAASNEVDNFIKASIGDKYPVVKAKHLSYSYPKKEERELKRIQRDLLKCLRLAIKVLAAYLIIINPQEMSFLLHSFHIIVIDLA